MARKYKFTGEKASGNNAPAIKITMYAKRDVAKREVVIVISDEVGFKLKLLDTGRLHCRFI